MPSVDKDPDYSRADSARHVIFAFIRFLPRNLGSCKYVLLLHLTIYPIEASFDHYSRPAGPEGFSNPVSPGRPATPRLPTR